MDNLTPPDASLVSAIADAMDARDEKRKEASSTELKLSARFARFKEIGAVILFISTLVGGALLTLEELRAKPTNDQMQRAIETRVEPVEAMATANSAAIEEIKTDVGKIEVKTERIEDVQSVIYDQNIHQGKVLDHIAGKKRGKPPSKPESLGDAERELAR